MMYHEFLELSGQDITFKQYDEIIEPMYMAVKMDKHEFIEFMTPTLKAMSKQNKVEERKNQQLVFISDGHKTPNHCWYLGKFAKLVDRDLRVSDGVMVYKVRELTEEEAWETAKEYCLYMHSSADILTWDPKVKVKWVK